MAPINTAANNAPANVRTINFFILFYFVVVLFISCHACSFSDGIGCGIRVGNILFDTLLTAKNLLTA